MRTLASLLVSLVAIHLGTISATPVKYTGVRRSENGTGWRPTGYYDSSVQILLLRSSVQSTIGKCTKAQP
ncbi:hypothetical protein J4E91_005109 [Alternaria rosae]|nr:hypothetical protein J4E91_005109 [Alternaria rosae]